MYTPVFLLTANRVSPHSAAQTSIVLQPNAACLDAAYLYRRLASKTAKSDGITVSAVNTAQIIAVLIRYVCRDAMSALRMVIAKISLQMPAVRNHYRV
jgi:hypothetical protein